MTKALARSNETGALGGIEGLAFGVLIFAFGTLAVINAWAVVDAKLAASAGAREAIRAYVESDSDAAGQSAGREAAVAAVAGYAHQSASITFSRTGDEGFGRCAPVRSTVSVRVPRIALPLIGGAGGEITVSASHVELVDPYRSGLAGVAQCQ